MRILFKLTTRNRPRLAQRAIDSIIQNATGSNHLITVSVDTDDNSWAELRGYDYLYSGKSKNKIDAINRDMDKIPEHWDILVNVSDDQVFIKKGFDDIIRDAFGENLDQFINFNDGNQKNNVATMTIVGKNYYKRDNEIYPKIYESVWCDVDACDVAFIRGKYKYMGDECLIFRHLHPAWGLAEYDDQYRASENLNVWGADLARIIKRKTNNYYLKPEEIVNKHKYPLLDMENWKRDLNNARQLAGLPALTY